MNVKLYLCTYNEYSSIFSRHFITGISHCKELSSQPLSELQSILDEKNLATLTKQKELLITSKDIIVTLIEKLNLPTKEMPENSYVLARLLE